MDVVSSGLTSADGQPVRSHSILGSVVKGEHVVGLDGDASLNGDRHNLEGVLRLTEVA